MSLISSFKTNVASDTFSISNLFNKAVEKIRMPSDVVSIGGFTFDKIDSVNGSNPWNITESPTSTGAQVVEHAVAGLKRITIKGWIYKNSVKGANKFNKFTRNVSNRLGQVSPYAPQYLGSAESSFNQALETTNNVKSLVGNTIGTGTGIYNEILGYVGVTQTEKHVTAKEILLAMQGTLTKVTLFGVQFPEKYLIKNVDIALDGSNSYDAFSLSVELVEYVQVAELKSVLVTSNNVLDANLAKQESKTINTQSGGKKKDVSRLKASGFFG
jgi:hypothetical protein